jgi:hypothetical protein
VTDPDSTTDANEAATDNDPFYAYKASLAGGHLMLWLRPDGLEWSTGHRSGLIRYDRFYRVRLSFRPATMQSHRFITEIWPIDGPKIQIASTSWQGLTMQQRQDAPYAAFITELHRRLAAAGSTATFRGGTAVAIYGVGLVVISGAMVAFVVLMVKAALLAEWRSVAIVAALLCLFAWQLGNYFVRNRPGDYRPDAIPPRLLPRA